MTLSILAEWRKLSKSLALALYVVYLPMKKLSALKIRRIVLQVTQKDLQPKRLALKRLAPGLVKEFFGKI